MATLAKHRIAQAGHHFKGGIQNSDHGAQIIGNYNVGGDFNFNRKCSWLSRMVSIHDTVSF